FSNNREETITYLYWDSAKSIYKGDFKIPSNILVGSIEYYLSIPTRMIASTLLPPSHQLNVYSKNADLMGPVFTKFIKNEAVSSSSAVSFGWSFTIQDKVNGFKDGFMVIKGEMDRSMYNITLSPSSASFVSGDLYEGLYKVSISESSSGISQTFTISEIFLQDNQ
ncbi:hypothetical protein DICPUDRAFT_21602, partial [Dictyostelium purpureum]